MATKSTCTSPKHQEYSCLIKWGVSSKKFTVNKWCKECIDRHTHTFIVQEYLTTNERETQDPEVKPRRGRKKKK